jgi:uncharacterized protein
MLYRMLGNTGLRVSALGFGAMRLPMVDGNEQGKVDQEKATPMIHRALDVGVNYVDTAVMYCNDDGQAAVGAALKGRRDDVVLSTKNHYYGEDEKVWWTNLENSLERLQTDRIDLYHIHGVSWNSYCASVTPRIGKWMQKAKDQGLITHICTSFHDDNEALMKLIETGFPAVITLQYNLLDRQLEEGMALAHERGMGVVVMGPVGGGRLGASSEALANIGATVQRTPELALRFVLANPNVSVCLSGMSALEHVDENVAIASDGAPLSSEDEELIRDHLERLKKMADVYCTGCRYCMPCVSGVNIPLIFQRYNEGRIYDLWEFSKSSYAEICGYTKEGMLSAEACSECGECLPKCPQNINIPAQLKEAHKALSEKGTP